MRTRRYLTSPVANRLERGSLYGSIDRAATMGPREESMSKSGWLLASLMGSFCLASFPVRAAENSGHSAAPRWFSDWEEGRKAAEASGRPLFVVFRCEH
jgi:hypothetical protein